MYTLAEHCDYGELNDHLIRDRIVVGLRDAKISEKLQLDPALTLEKAVTLARQKEAVHEQQSIVRSCGLSENKIDSVKDKDYCPTEIIKGLTDKGQFQYLTKLMGPQVGKSGELPVYNTISFT